MTTEQILVDYARRSHDNAERTANAAMRMEQTAEDLRREMRETRAEVVATRKDLRELSAVVGVLTVPPKQLASKKYNPTDTGSHMLVPAADLDALLADTKRREDAASYRGWRRRIKSVLLAVAVGSATFAGEHVAKWLFHL